MANTGRRTAATAVAILVVSCGTAASGNESFPAIVLTVDNRCGVPTSVLDNVHDAVADVYARIHVRVLWQPPGAELPRQSAAAVHLRVVLVSVGSEHDVLAALPLPQNARANVVGVAPTATRSIYIFCGRVAKVAAKSHVKRFDVVLSRALAHEIGHQVLPGVGHSDTGIMRGSLDLRQSASPQFTDEQGVSIRSRLAAQR